MLCFQDIGHLKSCMRVRSTGLKMASPSTGTLGVFSIGIAALALWLALNDWRLLFLGASLLLLSALLALVFALLLREGKSPLQLGQNGELFH